MAASAEFWLTHYLFLNQSQLLEVTLEEGHLLLLRLAVAVADDVVVLLLDLVELDLELHHLSRGEGP